MQGRAVALLVLLTLVWGTNWPLFPLVMREISVWTFRAISLPLAGIVLLAVAHWRGQSLRVAPRDRPALVLASLIYLAVWNIASGYAAILIPSGQAAVLGFTMPLWAALIGRLVFGDRLLPRQWLAVALAALGVVLLMQRSFAAYAQAPLGMALGLLSGVCWALGTLVLGRAAIAAPATVITAWQLLIASVPVVAAALLLGDGQWFVPSPTTLLLLGYITLVPMCIGNLAWFSIVGLLPANVAGLSSVLVPVVAMISGAWLLNEPLGATQWAAMACCAGALAIMILAPRPAPR